jgi:hypothetical protein
LPVETATYISDLVPANPLTTDAVNQGDDHLRLIKSVLQATLPGTGSLAGALVPVGGIIIWSGSVASIPTNWHLCDGTAGTPDLRDRFVVGAGGGTTVGATSGTPSISGTSTTSSDGSHSHTGATGGHTLTAGEIPGGNFSGGAGSALTYQTATPAATAAHTHPISADGAHTHTVTPPTYGLAYIQRVA